MTDCTIIYYTANFANPRFLEKVRAQLIKAKGDLPLISVSQEPMDFGENICVGKIGRSHLNIYRQLLIGAKAATTKYIAAAEDDTLYTEDHFKLRPSDTVFGYNMCMWSIYTWSKTPVFSYKNRRNLNALICERELFIEAMEERFAKYTDGNTPIESWAEPGKYEDNLDVTVRQTQMLFTHTPNIAFSHPEALAFGNLGTRKKLGYMKAFTIPYWGSAKDILKIYAE